MSAARASNAWTAVLAPGATPPDVVGKLNAAINASLGSDELQARPYQPRIMSLGEAAAFLAAEMRKWPPIVKAAGLRAK